MKNTKIFKLVRVLMLLPCLVFLVNCSKSSDKNNNRNQCYTNHMGQYVCNNGLNSGYRWNGQYCVDQNNQPVNIPYQQCIGGGGVGGHGQVCEGVYFSPQHNQSVCCGQACMQWYGQYGNCSGLQLINQMNQQVFCQ